MTVEVIPLHHQVYGQGSPLIILHGFLGSSGNWHTISKNAFSPHHRVFALDLRNHGRSPHKSDFDYPSMAADVLAFMDEQGLDQASVLGHSMGGKVAMYLALHHTTRVSSIIVADMAPREYPPSHLQILAALRSLDLSSFNSRKTIDDALAGSIPEWGVRQFLLKNLDSRGDGVYEWKNNLEVLEEKYENILVAITSDAPFLKPALFLKGSKSNYVKEEDLVDIEKLFPAFTINEIQGAGHWVHAEAPASFSEAVLQFLASIGNF